MYKKTLTEDPRFALPSKSGITACSRDAPQGEDIYKEKYFKLYQEFQILIKGIPDFLFHVDADFNVIWMNAAAESMLWSPSQQSSEDKAAICCSRFWFESPDDYDFTAIRKAFTTGRQQEETFEDGHQRTWGIKVFPPIRTETGHQTAIVMASDITEKLLLRSEALRSSQMAMLGQLAAGLGHEINNPINGIINYAQMLADRFPDGSDERDLTAEIIQEGARIAVIIKKLLVFAGDQHTQRTKIAPRDLIDDALTLAGSRLAEEDIEVRLSMPGNLPCLFGQASQLQQMVLNLISNASQALNIKFPDQKRKKVLVMRAKAVDNKKSAVVRLEFIDNGIGIGNACLEKIFDPFYTTSPKEKGKGLGLSVTRGIIKRHGGEIRISSQNGKYTKVVVDLPVFDKRREDDF